MANLNIPIDPNLKGRIKQLASIEGKKIPNMVSELLEENPRLSKLKEKKK
jgi:hypothetical protein